MRAVELLRDLMAEGVEFEADGNRVRWRNNGVNLTPERSAVLKEGKAEVLQFLSNAATELSDQLQRPAAHCQGYENEKWPIEFLCKVMQVTSRGFRAWKVRPMGQRQRDDLVILAHIREQHRLSLQSYGRSRMTEELQELGLIVGHRRVGRLMRENGIKIIRTRKYKATTDSNHAFNIAPNQLDQDFSADAPNQKWAGDISYIWTSEGWLYLAVILDLYSRRIIGWAVSNRMKRDLAIRALDMAVALRQPPKDCIHHTDRGSQYCSNGYQKRLAKHGFKVSMSGKGNCYDNSMVETFFKSLKAELIWRNRWETRRQAEGAIFQYIYGFYNPRRRHSSLGGKSPLAFERMVA